jgi:eukaryotic-like serine/threonine-protein kinase
VPQTDTRADGRSHTMIEAWKNWEGQVADGKFHLRQYLGGSERGPVFATEFGEQKAVIKLIPADAASADAQLARWALATNLTHPHLLRVLQTGRCQLGGARMAYAVMEFADEDLSQIIPQRALTPAEAREMLRPILEALAYLHGKGLVHGHVKPANIMAVGEQLKISSDGIGAAREMRGERGKPTAYDAPEMGTRGASAAGDVWSLGVTLVEVLTQRLPTWEWKGQEEPELPKAIPAPFGDIARQCLRRDPQRRWTLAEIGTRLDPDAPALGKETHVEPRAVAPPAVRETKATVVAKPPVQAKPRPAAKEMSAAPRRGFAIPTIAIGVVALVMVFAASKVFHRGSQASPETPAASAVDQPETQPKAEPVEPPQAAEKVAPEGSDSSGATRAAAVAAQPKPATKSAAGEIVRGGVLHQVLPNVPQSALGTISGSVRVSVHVQVDASGKVVGADLDSAGPSKYFASLAIKAARDWEFTPTKVDGENAASEWILRFEFAQDGTKVTSTEKAPT